MNIQTTYDPIKRKRVIHGKDERNVIRGVTAGIFQRTGSKILTRIKGIKIWKS